MQDEELAKEVNKIMKGEVEENFSISLDGIWRWRVKFVCPM